MKCLLSVNNLSISLHASNQQIKLVDNVSFAVNKGQAIGIVGESGCGKSVSAASILRLLPYPTLQVDSGEFNFEGELLNDLDMNQFNRDFRWRKTSMIFQESTNSFNPVLTIGNQFNEILSHVGKTKSDGEKLLIECGLIEVDRIWKSYPHQLSGGMKQRVAIAMALISDPLLLIADEPTTASDATVQLQILQLMKKLQKKRNMAIIFISHDLNVIKYICDYIYVFYCGKIIESQSVNGLFTKPKHHYTKGLLDSSLNSSILPKQPIPSIAGFVPPIENWHVGCSFSNRCNKAEGKCFKIVPNFEKINESFVACHYPLNL